MLRGAWTTTNNNKIYEIICVNWTFRFVCYTLEFGSGPFRIMFVRCARDMGWKNLPSKLYVFWKGYELFSVDVDKFQERDDDTICWLIREHSRTDCKMILLNNKQWTTSSLINYMIQFIRHRIYVPDKLLGKEQPEIDRSFLSQYCQTRCFIRWHPHKSYTASHQLTQQEVKAKEIPTEIIMCKRLNHFRYNVLSHHAMDHKMTPKRFALHRIQRIVRVFPLFSFTKPIRWLFCFWFFGYSPFFNYNHGRNNK